MNAVASGHLAGRVDRVRVRLDSSWSVVELTAVGGDPATLTGCTDCQPGQFVEADGQWVDNARFGRQFKARYIAQAPAPEPHSAPEITAWLGSGALPGIGHALATRIFQHFGVALFDILNQDPLRVQEVKGVSKKMATAIATAWRNDTTDRNLQLLFAANGLPIKWLRPVRDKLGPNCVTAIHNDPYALCRVRGLTFQKVDTFARSFGVPANDPRRLRAGLSHQLQQLTRMGDCGCQRAYLVNKTATLLDADTAAVRDALTSALAAPDPDVVLYEGEVYPAALAEAERTIAGTLGALAGVTPAYAGRVTDTTIADAASLCGMDPTPLQASAVHMALTHAVSVITGGPGCGKTATLKIILTAFDQIGVSVALTAPTGKAAQRAKEATGTAASTLHRLLRIHGGQDDDDPGSDASDEDEDIFAVLDDDKDHAITADVLIVDEASMLDVPLMARVVSAMNDSTSLLLVGDVDQLPSVGPGRVLADIIDSHAVPVTVLDKVFRQAAGSAIITNAYAINRGQAPHSAARDGDFFMLTERNTRSLYDAERAAAGDNPDPEAVPSAAAALIEALVAERLPNKYGVSTSDIQVLAPMRKGACGVTELNRRLQARLNPSPAQDVSAHYERFGVGDRVLQTHNDYALGIFNGDTGVVESIDGRVYVRFGEALVGIPFDKLGNLTLAYAMTIHKSQGSQAPIVVIPMLSAHWVMLQRNLLYTAVTRAQRLAVIVGQTRAIERAVATVTAARRVTRLGALLSSRETVPFGTVYGGIERPTSLHHVPLHVVEAA
ncbi:MAG TPA: ATP-dependent RecD-like DNA helicase [Rhodanobacteraceae bacterium]